MKVWLVRAGAHGEYEQKFIQEKRVYVTWDDLNVDLKSLTQKSQLVDELTKRYVDAKHKAILNWASQLWPFAHEFKIGDLVVLPQKTQPAIYIGEITGDYHFDASAASPYFHWRPVKWIGESIPRANFGQDLLYTFGAFLTICRVQRNNAEQRIQAMRETGWKPEALPSITKAPATEDASETEASDIEELARDQISQLISARFKGHGLTRLVDAILRAQGYTTYRSPEGADGGADILAGLGPLGFGQPRMCVEVKSESAPIDRSSVDKLLGAVTKFGAQEGLFVAWGGYKSTVQKELAQSFFRVRLWTQKELLEQLFLTYDRLDDDVKAELSLKRIWTVAAQDDDG